MVGNIDFASINNAAIASLPGLVERWLPGGKRADAEYVARNPTRTDHRPGSFCINLRTGRWSDFATDDKGGDPVSFLAYLQGLSQADAARRLAEELGLDSGGNPGHDKRRKPADKDERAERRQKLALSIWRECGAAARSDVESYLRSRGIKIPVPPSLRFHPHVEHRPTGFTFPAMVAGIQAPDRRVVAIHRTYLLPGGRGKAQVSTPKMALGTLGNGAVRLAAAAPVLGIAEGIETALSAMQLFRLPCWAALGSRFDQIALPEEVRHVVVFADKGKAGDVATKKAERKFRNQNRQVTIRFPDHGADWNDDLQAREAVA